MRANPFWGVGFAVWISVFGVKKSLGTEYPTARLDLTRPELKYDNRLGGTDSSLRFGSPFLARTPKAPSRLLASNSDFTSKDLKTTSIDSKFQKIEFDHLQDDTVYFNTTPPTEPQMKLKTGLFELSYIGILNSNEGGDPYFLFGAKPCQNCPDDRSLFAIRPSDGKSTSFIYPGKIFEPRSHAMVLESRAFYGKCLSRHGTGLLVFQREKVDRRSKLQASVIIAEASKNHLTENLFERHLPSIKTTLQMVGRKLCHEIEGRKRIMPTRHDLISTGSTSEDDDETPEK